MMFYRILCLISPLILFTACMQTPETLPASEASLSVAAALETPSGGPAPGIIVATTDGGAHWQDLSGSLPQDFRPGFLHLAGEQLYIGADNQVYFSSAKASTPNWTRELLLEDDIHRMYAGASGPYALSYDKGFYQKFAFSDDWRPVYRNIRHWLVHTLLETSGGALLVAGEEGIQRSTDNGNTWKTVYEGDMVISLAASNSLLFAGTVKGLLRSSDGGQSWQQVFKASENMHQVIALPGGWVAAIVAQDMKSAAPSGSRLYLSVDGGTNWQAIDAGLPAVAYTFDENDRNTSRRTILDLEKIGSYLFCSHQAGIFRSADMGKTWELVRSNTDPDYLYEMVVEGDKMYAVRVFVAGC